MSNAFNTSHASYDSHGPYESNESNKGQANVITKILTSQELEEIYNTLCLGESSLPCHVVCFHCKKKYFYKKESAIQGSGELLCLKCNHKTIMHGDIRTSYVNQLHDYYFYKEPKKIENIQKQSHRVRNSASSAMSNRSTRSDRSDKSNKSNRSNRSNTSSTSTQSGRSNRSNGSNRSNSSRDSGQSNRSDRSNRSEVSRTSRESYDSQASDGSRNSRASRASRGSHKSDKSTRSTRSSDYKFSRRATYSSYKSHPIDNRRYNFHNKQTAMHLKQLAAQKNFLNLAKKRTITATEVGCNLNNMYWPHHKWLYWKYMNTRRIADKMHDSRDELFYQQSILSLMPKLQRETYPKIASSSTNDLTSLTSDTNNKDLKDVSAGTSASTVNASTGVGVVQDQSFGQASQADQAGQAGQTDQISEYDRLDLLIENLSRQIRVLEQIEQSAAAVLYEFYGYDSDIIKCYTRCLLQSTDGQYEYGHILVDITDHPDMYNSDQSDHSDIDGHSDYDSYSCLDGLDGLGSGSDIDESNAQSIHKNEYSDGKSCYENCFDEQGLNRCIKN